MDGIDRVQQRRHRHVADDRIGKAQRLRVGDPPGALILYPRYLDPVTGLPCPPETLVQRLSEQRRPRTTWLTRVRGLQGRLRRPRAWARNAA